MLSNSFRLLTLTLALAQNTTHALIMVGGEGPIGDPGWPVGCEELANLSTRKGFMQGPLFGKYEFWYRCKNTEDFNEALVAFSKIKAPNLDLVLHDDPHFRTATGEDEKRTDFTFTVWIPRDWHRFHNNPRNYSEMSGLYSGVSRFREPVPPPTIDAYLGGGTIDWKEVVIPDNVRVIDNRRTGSFRPVRFLVEVYDLATGKVVPGASVTIVDMRYKQAADRIGVVASGNCDENGRFAFLSVAQMDPRLRVSAEGFLKREWSFDREKEAAEQTVSINLSRPHPLTGVVTDVKGKGLSGVTLQPHNTMGLDSYGYICEATGATNEKGTFSLELPEGYTELRIRAPGYYYPTTELFRVPSNDLNIVMRGTGTVRGRVIDENGDPPKRKTHIMIEEQGKRNSTWGGSALCGKGGSFEFERVPAGEYRVGLRLYLFNEGQTDPSAKTISVEAGEVVDLEIVNSFK